ncbi:vitamin K epoxide reductase family protein, partial [Streptomyces sp. NPDC003483]
MSKTTVKDVSTEPDRVDGPRTVGGSRALALLLVITGAAGLLAAWVITIDKFKLLE